MQEGQRQLRREKKMIICAEAVNLTHKLLCAVLFGLLGRQSRSVPQLALLYVLHASFLLYLAVWRPFLQWQRQVLELLSHGLEVVLLVCALVLLNAKPSNRAPTTWIMIVCFFLVALAFIVHEVWVAWMTTRALWDKSRGWFRSRLEREQMGPEKHKHYSSQFALKDLERGKAATVAAFVPTSTTGAAAATAGTGTGTATAGMPGPSALNNQGVISPTRCPASNIDNRQPTTAIRQR
ncbi:hypothetical protein PLESTB_000107000 [Pleodorina starrii]|uniref:Transmembrane protein n=1 Tax=Pleodorina starrii TaxID=330485 RepID=A0A9W6BB25_9CHLO|nr:hypothetical protein PLESTB_000107000 [Pleodorina starrii]GLC71840.1 hypothetical protein PLESTF_001172700 [Pleodorina starrii]